MSKQIYQFDNKAFLQNNDLFVISNENTVDHELENQASIQSNDYFFPRMEGSYTPVFSNIAGANILTGLTGVYIAYDKKAGNWAQVTVRYQYRATSLTFTGDMTVPPVGGNFTSNLEALAVCFAAPQANSTGTLGRSITSNVGVNTVRIVWLLSSPTLLNILNTTTLSFIYKMI